MPDVNKVLMLDPNGLHTHEATDDDQVDVMLKLMRENGTFHPPVLVDLATKVVLDGHHRLLASKALGCKRIPCFCVDYVNDDSIRVESWRAAISVTKQQVIEMGLSPDVFPLKTTRHIYKIPVSVEPVPLSKLL